MVKQSRKRQSRRSRKQKRQSRRNQRGGAASFNAPYEALTGPARDAAQVAPLDRYIAALPGLIPRQGGGRYRQRNGNGSMNTMNTSMNTMNAPTNTMNTSINTNGSGNSMEEMNGNSMGVMTGGSAPFGDPYTYKLNGGRRYRRKNKKSRRSSRRNQSQRGGNAPFDAPYSLGYKLPGVNEQFASEGSVNSLYSQSRGAQGY